MTLLQDYFSKRHNIWFSVQILVYGWYNSKLIQEKTKLQSFQKRTVVWKSVSIWCVQQFRRLKSLIEWLENWTDSIEWVRVQCAHKSPAKALIDRTNKITQERQQEAISKEALTTLLSLSGEKGVRDFRISLSFRTHSRALWRLDIKVVLC